MQQQILNGKPDSKLAVYSIWFSMLPDDSRAQWDSSVIGGPRVSNLWDEQRAAGRYYANGHGAQFGAVYDVWLLYGPDAGWGSKPLNRGEPIINTFATLSSSVAPLLRA